MRALNAVRTELAALDAATPVYRLRALKRDEMATDEPVAVYCAYGFHIGCSVTRTLRERGFDARFIRGGVSAWYAAGGARALRTS